jgi:peptidoglycan/xylan/chitin deacetylase (PgdA/CDA1 family)
VLLVLFGLWCVAAVTAAAQDSSRAAKASPNKRIAITFDELPAARTFGEVDRVAVTYLLLDALRKHEVKATAFVVGEQIGASYDILGQWLNAGHALGSMTYTGQDYNMVGPEQFIADIRRGAEAIEPMLAGVGQKKRYFRYPYLHYGDTVERRKAATLYLEDRGYIVSPATVIPEDYLYDLSLMKLGRTPDSAAYEQLMNDYVNHVLDELARQEGLAREMLARPVRHILQLRVNRLNAVSLEVLLSALEAEGYGFVSLDTALKDDVYAAPEAYYDLKGVSYLEMIANSDPALIPAE